MAASFIFDASKETPQSLARKRAIIEALAGPTRAPRNLGEGLSAIGDAIGYRMLSKGVEKGEAEGKAARDAAMNPIWAALGGGEAAGGAGGPSPVAQALAGTTVGGSAGPAPDLSGNDIYSGFMDTVRAGGVTNPNALAAIASTGKAESGFDPGNVYRTWSDPSQSGQAGTAGGIMSWRGPRLQAMQQFAKANGGDPSRPSPELQAQFLLQEDPGLIQRLQAAKSPEEAQQLMNNAWRFAGYDRPGGEAGRRIALANSFASQFGQQPNDPVQVASLDPSAGAPAPTGIRQPAPAAPAIPSPQVVQTPEPGPSAPPAPQRVAQAGPTLQQLYQALQSPWLGDSDRAIIMGLIQRQQEASDPLRQLQIEKLQREVNTPQKNWQKLDDGTLFDPSSGEVKRVDGGANAGKFRFEGNSVEAQSLNGLMDSGMLTPEQAQQIGAGKTITDPATGAIIFMTPQGVFGQSPQGGPPQPITPAAPPVAPTGPAGAVTPPVAAPVPQQPAQGATQPVRPGMIPITDPKAQKPTEAQRNRVSSVDQAFGNISSELDRYLELVKKSGIEMAPGETKDQLNTVRQGIMLQMKELFNLGVLNGPDLSLMERMIYDPVVDVTKEGGFLNLPSQMWDATVGDPSARAASSVDELKRMLSGIRDNAQSSVTPGGSPAANDGGWQVLPNGVKVRVKN